MTSSPPLTEDELCKVAFVTALRDALNVVSGKWKLAILCTMLLEPRRFNEMERLLAGLSPRMLSRELRELEINGVVERIQVVQAGSTVQLYQLTPSGKKLEQVIVEMATWGVQHRKSEAARH